MERRPFDVQSQHFLFVTSPLQGHVNPVLRLASRIMAANPSARVTFSNAVSGHRRMFPSLASPDAELAVDGVLHVPYSDGHDEGFDPKVHDVRSFNARACAVGGATLSGVIERLAARGMPVTRVVYTFLVGWALDVARARGVPAALFWIQPATVFAVYYHHFHGHGEAIASCATSDPGRGGSVRLPGLPPLRSDALPSIVLVTSPDQRLYGALSALRNLFAGLDAHRHTVLINTFEALEPDALRAVPRLEVLAVGPVMPDDGPSSSSCTELVKHDDDPEDHMEWLDTHATGSVVYVSFGTMLPASKRQEVELVRGLEDTNRPYMWARGAAKAKLGGGDQDGTVGGGIVGARQGMVVEWCDQARVLAHPAVGCFVTHCGWNSALEGVTRGVPIVAVPQWTDQPTNAWLIQDRAGVGVRAAVDGEGVVEHDELRRCVEEVIGDGERGVEIRARVHEWMEKAREAVAGGGTSEKNVRAFASGL
ncbi:unnamed protein product [Urochloa humidicola]